MKKRGFEMSHLPLTPSDSKEYQDSHPIKPEDEFIVSFSCEHAKGYDTLSDVFNKHGKGEFVVALERTFWVKDMSWDIVNELRNNSDVSACGPAAKKQKMI